MPSAPALAFWLCLGFVAYAYAGYPLLAALLARRSGRPPRPGDPGDDRACPALTVIVAAYDEEARIAARVADLLAQDYPPSRLQLIVASDGSRDRTVACARAAVRGDPRARVLDLPRNAGKAAALNAAMELAVGDVVAFADVRQRFAPGALRALTAAFADAEVGAVSGELVIDGDAAGGVGLYWRIEKRLRHDEARLGWLHGCTGAIHAVRRELFRPLPPGTLLDDMWIPLQAVFAGKRVWMARDAVAHDRASGGAGEEFARKLRTLAGNWQLVARMPALLNPFANPVFFAWCSHKFARLLAPWALLAALAASALAAGAFYRFAFVAQLAAYAVALAGLRLPRIAARIPLLGSAGAFVALNAAALLSLPASLTRDPARLWKKH